ncbi:hypothetical protein [Microbacterium sediminis]|uniref:Uncharacterized protein n=1 Tax=Microbacterium sediminis TaxID=904291 RepID=A0A1B9NGF2_9MICO|nr:hypothetical protein [Microbacterium sediminis]OCG75689.1 hypothetical protein A7J15_01150 [Microbacterium sediminis]QBR74085.1 dioxygenase [Microbacterium sediminis]
MAGRTKNDDRAARERARAYAARKALHDTQIARRRRDNVIVSIAAGVVILAAVGAQALFYTSGPGVATPEPSSTVTPSEAPSVVPTPPTVTPVP